MTHPRSIAARAFTMLELVMVMMLLVVLAALTTPRLSDYFRGRQVDDEARRLWALTEHARSEAIAQGLPVVVWADPDTGEYGYEAGPGLGVALTPVTHALARDISLEADADMVWNPDGSVATESGILWRLSDTRRADSAWLLQYDAELSVYSLSREAVQ